MLVCPGCRSLEGTTVSLFTLERDGDQLVCQCGRKYAIVDGVPIVGPEISTEELPDLPEAQLEHLSTYLDAHWGPGYDRGARVFVERIAALPRVHSAVELGCSAGRIVGALAADRTVGVDLNFGMLRRARRLLDGQTVRYARRVVGQHYEPALVHGITAACMLLCADALDPPLIPGSYDRVVALNLLDSVRDPEQLLAVVHGLCAPGGELVLASPYSWLSGATQLGGADPAGFVTSWLGAHTYTIAEEAEVTWSLRRDARSEVSYRVHYLRARKGT